VKHIVHATTVFILAILFATHATPYAYGQAVQPKNDSALELRNMFRDWLDAMKDAIKEEYYDSKYHGIDLNARFDAAKTQINSLNYDWQMLQVMAQLLIEFNDSHTYLIPPPRKDYFDYGFNVQIVGTDCLVTSVTKGSDAELAGLEVGDTIIRIGSIAPDRDNLWKIHYVHYLTPPDTIELTVRKGDSPEKLIKVKAKVVPRKDYQDERKKRKDKEKDYAAKCTEINKEIMACKLHTFNVEKSVIDKMMKSVEGHSKLILDLRGNGGGLVSIEEYLTGYFFTRDIRMLDFVRRKKTEARVAKSGKEKAFNGDLIVLVDSESASASEVFARVVQLEKRGKVIGDISNGFVMTSVPISLMRLNYRFGYKTKAFPLFMSLSIGDVVMSDGGRLERKGVIPDIPIIPTGATLKKQLDPVLAVASTIFGHKLSPEDAGKMQFMKETTNKSFGIDTNESEKP